MRLSLCHKISTFYVFVLKFRYFILISIVSLPWILGIILFFAIKFHFLCLEIFFGFVFFFLENLGTIYLFSWPEISNSLDFLSWNFGFNAFLSWNGDIYLFVLRQNINIYLFSQKIFIFLEMQSYPFNLP